MKTRHEVQQPKKTQPSVRIFFTLHNCKKNYVLLLYSTIFFKESKKKNSTQTRTRHVIVVSVLLMEQW